MWSYNTWRIRKGSRVSNATNLLRLKRILKKFPDNLHRFKSRRVNCPSFCNRGRRQISSTIPCQATMSTSKSYSVQRKGSSFGIVDSYKASISKAYRRSYHVCHLANYILKKDRLLSHAFHPMQLFLVKILHLVWCYHTITVQVHTLEPEPEITQETWVLQFISTIQSSINLSSCSSYISQ